MCREKRERESKCKFISLGVCTISLSEGNANGSYVPASRLHFLSHIVLCFMLGPEAQLPTQWAGVEQQKEQLLGREDELSSL